MSRVLRRSCVLAVLALAALPFVASGAGAQVESPVTITVRKVVDGTATTGSSVTLTCLTSSVTFNFDATGAPTTFDGEADVTVVDGAWQLTGNASGAPFDCTLTETATGGAASTAWTCSYTSEEAEVPEAEQVEELGCAAASGDGVGPAGLTLGSFLDVSSQSADVTFTNTFSTTPLTPLQPAAAPALVVQPTFTG